MASSPPQPQSQASWREFLSQPMPILWRSALVKLPRVVPISTLRLTSPEGPQPFVLSLPSRGKHKIPCYVFVPPISAMRANCYEADEWLGMSGSRESSMETARQKKESSTIHTTEDGEQHQHKRLPVMIDFHGGGFVLGSCLEQAPFCAKMARDLGCVVVSVDYRMGPVDQFPAAIEDAEDILSAVLDEGSPGFEELRMAVAQKIGAEAGKIVKKARPRRRINRPQIIRSLTGQNKKSSTSSPALQRVATDNSMNSEGSGTRKPALLRTLTGQRMKGSKEQLPRPENDSSSGGGGGGTTLAKSNSDLGDSPSSGTHLAPPSTHLAPPPSSIPSSTPSAPSTPSTHTVHRTDAEYVLNSTHHPKVITTDILDEARVSISGFSSGGNLALNLALSIPATAPYTDSPWPTRLPSSSTLPSDVSIPLLLYYPSFDARQLPSERTRPQNMQQVPVQKAADGTTKLKPTFWTACNDLLMPTYLPRGVAGHPRASPGLAPVETEEGGQRFGLHERARALLVLPELDDLAEQSEEWVRRVEREGRSDDVRVERFEGVTHGWTQMPESWLNEKEKKSRSWIFEESVEFVRGHWGGTRCQACVEKGGSAK